MPTRKWWATQATALGALLTMWATTGGWDTEETVSLIGLCTQAVVGYLVTNKPGTSGIATDEGQPTL